MDLLEVLAKSKTKQGRPDDRLIPVQEGEFVIPADVVVFIGEGDSEKGFELLTKFVDDVKKQIDGKT